MNVNPHLSSYYKKAVAAALAELYCGLTAPLNSCVQYLGYSLERDKNYDKYVSNLVLIETLNSNNITMYLYEKFQ